MSSHSTAVGLRAVLALTVILAGLIAIRSLAHQIAANQEKPHPSPAFPSKTDNEKAESETGLTKFPTPPPQPHHYEPPRVAAAPPEASESLEMNAIRPRIVEPAPAHSAPPPSSHVRVFVHVEPKKWSEPVNVPQGTSGRFTFSLGRMELEVNGEDRGRIYRSPLMEPSSTMPGAIRVKPFGILDKTPRTVSFGPDVHTLRFMSLEKTSEDVVVEFRD